ncbi:hypothetical protein BN1723_005580 [Verticillium longisporum]|uniref:Hook C-terminal domain-containing protein n=1 Tax=Verticillium longisporum TaxID=100787 RepID=A0A0G4NA70_VERLO|nr:hypothetical protein BN1723_005580 [Verticillium longisporum]
MQDYEVQLIELDGKRKEEYNEMIALREHLESLSAQRKADEMFIGELQEQISTGGHGAGNKSPSSPGGAGFNLDEELENAKDVAPNLSLEISRLKAENQLLRSSMGSGSENSRLRKELEEERAQRNRLQKNFNEIHEKHTVAEAQVQSLLRDMTDEKYVEKMDALFPAGGNVPMLTQEFFTARAYNELVAQQKKSELELKQHIELATELRNRIADRDRELLSARTDLSALLRSSMGSGSENSRLRRELEEERAQRNRLQKNFNDIHEKHTVAEAQVQSLLRDMTDEKYVEKMDALFPAGGNVAMLTQEFFTARAYTELVAQQKKSELELKQHIELATELRNRIADRDRELLSVKTDLSAVEKDSIEALEELKATDKLISGSLQEELEALRTDHKNATTDVQEAQKALTKALLEKDELRKDLDTVKEQGAGQDSSKYLEKIQQLRDRLKERNEVSGPLSVRSRYTRDHIVIYPDNNTRLPGQPTRPPACKQARSSILPARPSAALVRDSHPLAREPAFTMTAPKLSLSSQLEKAERDRHDLTRKLKASTDGGAALAQKTQSDQIIKNLQRENALIATAWYDLTSRLQSNHVVLQRRNDVPRSWLNKQRQMVNGTAKPCFFQA